VINKTLKIGSVHRLPGRLVKIGSDNRTLKIGSVHRLPLEITVESKESKVKRGCT
jgi:hypothetical protein